MKPFSLPKKLTNDIDKTIRNFFWGHNSNTKKIHTLKWDEIAKPKNLGGLGIRKSLPQNQAILLSTLWKIQKEPQNLLSWVCLSKYGPIFPKKRSSSSLFNKSSLKLFPKFSSCTKKVISDGNSTNFWKDNWLGRNLSYVYGPLPHGEEEKKVSSYFSLKNMVCKWNLEDLPVHLPPHIIALINATPVSIFQILDLIAESGT